MLGDKVTGIPNHELSNFMLKEIHEQPSVLVDIIEGRLSRDSNKLELLELNLSDQQLKSFETVLFIGMGTSLHAGMVGKLWFERIAAIKAESDNSSEFKDRNPILNKKTLAISISQSGETGDTLSAMKTAKESGATVLNIGNVEGSPASKFADHNLSMAAGKEISVAATKSFECSLLTLYMLAIKMGLARNSINSAAYNSMINELSKLPKMVTKILETKTQIEELCSYYYKYNHFLYLGRNLNFPIALEGALKLKEISYIHAEGYPSGELKHGPMALIDKNMPVVVVMSSDSFFSRNLNTVSEIVSQGGKVISVVSEDSDTRSNKADNVISIPKSSDLLSPLLTAIPLQLLAYYIAIKRGCNVDQPRNLTKSVPTD